MTKDEAALKIVTLGVYGFSEEAFFEALREAEVDTFCDIRQRRGLRGSRYAFANSRRLQERLAAMGIRYLHRKDLAPTKAVRQQQKEAAEAEEVAKRQRTTLSEAFVGAYREEVLATFEPRSLLADLEEAHGRHDDALASRRRAQEIVTYIADHAGSDDLRDSFVALPEVRRLHSFSA